MIILTDTEFHIEEKTACAIGKFDGVHIGHMELLVDILKKKEEGFKTAVFTFNPSAAVFFGGKDIKDITTVEEKRDIFDRLGIDYLIEYPLNEKTASLLAEDFIKDILVAKMNIGYLVAGDDLSFGYKGAGNANLLEKFSDEFGYTVRIIDKLMYRGIPVSSTLVRSKIENGDIETANELLGYEYSFIGKVMTGFKLGSKMGMPTLNVYPISEKLLPPFGVYFSKVIFRGTEYYGITNIGTRPTVSGGDLRVSVETFLYDFDRDIYGEDICVKLLHFKRPEQKFDSKEELFATIGNDIKDGRTYFSLQ